MMKRLYDLVRSLLLKRVNKYIHIYTRARAHTHTHTHTQTRYTRVYEVDDPGFESRQEQEIFCSPKPSRPVLGSTQLPMQRVPGVFPGVKLREHEVMKTKRGSRITTLFPQLLGAIGFCIVFILNCFEFFVMEIPMLQWHTWKLEFQGFYWKVGR